MLFKYASYSRALEILTTRKVRLTQPSDFNDPFELHPQFQLMSKEDIEALPPAIDEEGKTVPGSRQLTAEAMQRMIEAAQPLFTNMMGTLPNSPGTASMIDNNAIGRHYYDQRFGIFSLSETHNNLLMWAHYADNHKGVVIGFDEEHPFFNGTEIAHSTPRLNRVEYNPKRPVLSLTTRNTPQVFLRKSPEWSYEREWRLIRPLTEASEEKPRQGLAPVFIFDIPVDAIKMVITGAMMASDEYQSICRYCTSTVDFRNTSLHHMKLSDEHYSLDTLPPLTEDERQRLMTRKICSAKPFDI